MGKCGARELNYASDVDVIFVAEPAGRAGEDAETRRAAHRHPAGRAPDPGLLAEHPRGRAVAGRPEPAARGHGRPAGPHAGQPPRLLPALGQDLGVPGAAQGPAGRPATSSSAQAYVDAVEPAGLAGGPARRLRRRRAGHAAPGGRNLPAPRRPTGSSSWAPAGCATSSSPSSCSSSCTAGPTSRCASPATLPALAALAAGGYVGRDDARRPGRRVPVPAHGRAPAPAAPAAAYPHPARGPGRAAPAAARSAAGCDGSRTRLRAGPGRELLAQWRQHAGRCGGCTRSCSTARCSTRWPGCPATRPGSPRRPPSPAGGARLRRPGRRAAAHRGADRRGVPAGGDPADAAAGDARSGSPTRPSRTPGCSAFRQVSDALGHTPWYLRLLRDDGDWRRADGAGAGLQPVRGRPAAARAGSRWPCSATTSELAPRTATSAASRGHAAGGTARRRRGRRGRGPRAAPPGAAADRRGRPARPCSTPRRPGRR